MINPKQIVAVTKANGIPIVSLPGRRAVDAGEPRGDEDRNGADRRGNRRAGRSDTRRRATKTRHPGQRQKTTNECVAEALAFQWPATWPTRPRPVVSDPQTALERLLHPVSTWDNAPEVVLRHRLDRLIDRCDGGIGHGEEPT